MLMNDTQPEPPEPAARPIQDAAPVKKPATLDDLLAVLAASQADQRKILEILETPLREAAAKKAQDEEHARQMKEAMDRGDFRPFSG